MAILDIVTYPDKSLRRVSKQVEDIDDATRKLINDMAETMYEAPGVGLAAIQVGIDKRIIVYDISEDRESRDFQALLNPEIISTEGELNSENEGCLSVPELRADVKRAESCVVEGLDKEGNPICIEADGVLAVVLQHEIDHIEGVLFLDRISSLKRSLYKRKVKKKQKKE